MKFKLIFIIFNAIVLFSFLFITLLPIIMLGVEYAAPFWERSWYLLILFILILGGLDFYFIRNWKFFSVLERQDWDEIQSYLEHRLFTEKRYLDQGIQILLTLYIQKNEPDKIIELGAYVKTDKPRMYNRHMLSFGIGYLLNEDYSSIIDMYAPLISDASLSMKGWADWYVAFANLRLDRQDEGRSRLKLIAEKTKDELLKVVSLYMLVSIIGDAESGQSYDDYLNKIAQKYSPALWAKQIESRRERLHILPLTAVLQQAGEWVLSKSKGESDE